MKNTATLGSHHSEFPRQAEIPMARTPEPSLEDMLRTIAVARLILGPHMNVQAPPNLKL